MYVGSRKSLIRQVSERLHSFKSYGQSKYEDKQQNGGKPCKDKIYSISTMKAYHESCCQFAKWVKNEHNCRYLDDAKQYVGEYLNIRMKNNSAWSVCKDASALAKLYQCNSTDFGVGLPTRHRGDRTKHNPAPKGFKEENHKDLADFCRATGLRRHEVTALTIDDIKTNTKGETIVHVKQGKGGKARTVTALNNTPLKLKEQAILAGKDKIIDHIPNRAPIHSWRREFAKEMYNKIARDVSNLTSKEIYKCRDDMKGRCFDRTAMKKVSVALGHARTDVVTNYLK